MRRLVLLLTAMALTLVLASGVALAVNKVGTNGPDTLRGTNGADNLLGRGGNDILLALAGNDNLHGGPGKDFVVGGRGSDNILGEEGNDLIIDGPDREFATDKLSAGDGNDAVGAVNSPAFKDIVTCGGGFDRVMVDRKDVVAPDCEKVFFGPASEDEFIESLPQSFFAGLHPQVFEFFSVLR